MLWLLAIPMTPWDLGSAENPESSRLAGSLPVNYSESDLESADLMPLSKNVELSSSASSYHKSYICAVQHRWIYNLRMNGCSDANQHYLLHRSLPRFLCPRDHHDHHTMRCTD